ncbi:OTU protein [Microbotryomycetes sp. JL221]|nr:OTU protein [Microbotryomycetes sp. JL221]
MSATSSAQPNPLLARGKLKKASKPKQKSANKSKQSSGTTTPSTTAQAPMTTSTKATMNDFDEESRDGQAGNDADVDDLADQLLAQLDARDQHSPPLASTSREQALTAHSNVKSNNSSTSLASHGSGSSSTTREKLHDIKQGVKDVLLPNHKAESSNATQRTSGGDKVSRQKARKLKKEQHYENMRRQAEEEMLAENDRSVQNERDAILAGCQKLGVRVKEINPDGHCLYSAIADQVNMLGLAGNKEDYSSVRSHAAEYMRAHPDEFLPFLPSEINDDDMMNPAEYSKYCDTVEKTAEWGGEPEINALSKFYHAPIHVLQAGTDIVKVGEDAPTDRGPILISYHRKMYGLGEHYNSLRPATYSGSV